MRPDCRRASQNGFKLIELTVVIVILGVLAAVAIPKFFNLETDARESACKGGLGGLRSAISNYYVQSATPSGGTTATWPTVAQMSDGTVLASAPPDNPYDTDASPNNIVDGTGQTQGTVIGTTKGWAYNPTNGELWANSNVDGENAW